MQRVTKQYVCDRCGTEIDVQYEWCGYFREENRD